MSITIRRLQAEDAEPCVALRRAMLLDAPASFGSSPEDDPGSNIDQVRKRLADSTNQATFGALDAKAGLVGSVGVWCPGKPKRQHVASIWGMYVAPSHRRQGIGRSLMHAAIAFARPRPAVQQVQLSVSDAAPGARRLYDSLGFIVWGTEPDALRVNGQSHDEHHLTLMLTDHPTP